MTAKASNASAAAPGPRNLPLGRGHHPLHIAHAIYKQLLAPVLHALASTLGLSTHCRFQPTCSDYAALALAQHGPIRGLRLAATRLLRCHPFTRGGWDPVPAPRPSTIE